MKKFLIMMMCVIMVVCFMPTVAMADSGPVDVSTLDGLKTELEKAASAGSGDTTINITADITLTENQSWSSLHINGYQGAGTVTIKGNGHKIVGLDAPLFSGGFAGTSGLVIDNLTIDNANIKDETNNQGIGAFISNVDSMPKISLTNCHLKNSTIVSTGGARVGGLIGWTSGYNKPNDGPVDTYINVTGCSVTDTNITAAGSVGAIIGHAGCNPATYHTIKGCTVTRCTLNSTDNGDWRVGVVVGTANVGQVTIENITESGNTLTQTGKTAPEHSNLYGRFVPVDTGVLVIDGTFIGRNSSNYVANTNGRCYTTLADAINAAQSGSVVKLLNNVTDSITIPSGKTVTLDLNGQTFTAATREHAITNNGTLVIKDSKGNGSIVCDNAGKSVLQNEPKAVATIESGSLRKNLNAGSNDYYVITNHGTLTMNGGTVESASTHSSAIENGWYTPAQNSSGQYSVMTINGGSVSANGGLWTVKNDDYGKMTINGGTFSNSVAQHGTVLNWNELTITGGTFNASNTAVATMCESSSENDKTPKYVYEQGKTTITGGTFNGNNGALGTNNDYSKAITVSVTGGTFSTTPKDYLPAGSRYYVSQEGDKFVVRYSAPYIPTTPATPTDNVTNSGSTTTDNAATSADLSGSTSTSNGTTSATVDKTTADKIVDKAVENKSTEVVIDATANTTTAANSTTIAQVTIPTETLGAIAEKTEADVTIKTDVAEVKMDNAAAAAVSEQAEGDTVQIIAEKVKEDATEVHFELKVVCSDGKVISDFKGGNVAVTVALPKAMADKKVVCVYIDDNGHMSKVAGQKNADGTYTFNTGHFSSYAIMAEEEADAAIAAQKEAIKNIKIKLTSKQVKTKAGKKAVKITWTAAAGDKVLDGVEVFRSTERYKGYGTEPFYTSTKGGNTGSYTNTKSLKKGTKYYYRVRGYVLVDGQKVYTDYSTKAWRTVK